MTFKTKEERSSWSRYAAAALTEMIRMGLPGACERAAEHADDMLRLERLRT